MILGILDGGCRKLLLLLDLVVGHPGRFGCCCRSWRSCVGVLGPCDNDEAAVFVAIVILSGLEEDEDPSYVVLVSVGE